MEKVFMSAGLVTAIVLLIVGIVKLPFKNFKKNHPNWYRAVFNSLSIVLAIAFAVFDELYILCGEILSVDFAVLICVVIAGIFGSYSGIYEGLGLKELVKKLIEKAKKAIEMSEHKKAEKYLNKIEDIDEAIKFLEERRNNSEV